jgi:ABC-type amino acid transport system permease subunit
MGTEISKVMAQWLETAPRWILELPEWASDFCYRFFKSFIYDGRYMMFVRGLGNTLFLTFFSLLIGIALGVVVSLIRVTWDKNGAGMRPGPGRFFLALANAVSKIYLTLIRGTPIVVQIMILYFIVMTSASKLLTGVVAFGINSGAYVAEIMRSGIMSIDQGQNEAGRSLGFGYGATMRYIILPQAFKNVLPALGNEFIVLLKETAVAGYIGLPDLAYAGSIVGGLTYEYFIPLIIGVALVYLALVIFFSWLLGKLERRLRTSER